MSNSARSYFSTVEIRAIILEDEEGWAAAIRKVLKEFRIESEATKNPTTAEELLEDTAFKILFVDLALGKAAPTTAPFDVVNDLRRTDVLVIILSSFPNDYDRQLEQEQGDNLGGMIARLAGKVWLQIHKDAIRDTQTSGQKAPLQFGLPKLKDLLKKQDLVGEVFRRCMHFRSADGNFEYRIHRNGGATGRWRGDKLNHTAPRAALVKHVIVETMAGRSVPTEELLDKLSETVEKRDKVLAGYVTSYEKVLQVFRDDPLRDGFFQNVSAKKHGEYRAVPFI